jgi:hypothetical protein
MMWTALAKRLFTAMTVTIRVTFIPSSGFPQIPVCFAYALATFGSCGDFLGASVLSKRLANRPSSGAKYGCGLLVLLGESQFIRLLQVEPELADVSRA